MVAIYSVSSPLFIGRFERIAHLHMSANRVINLGANATEWDRGCFAGLVRLLLAAVYQ